jgi:transcriptional regulator with XRE-family HTH domain
MNATKPRQTNYSTMTADQLRAAREELGLTQSEAASKYEISLRGYKNYELGERPIPGPIKLLTQYFLMEHRKNSQSC